MRKIVLLLIVLCFWQCSVEQEHIESDHDSKINKKLEIQKKLVLGKKIMGMGSVIGDSLNISNGAVFFYTGFDCGSCIEVGFKVVKELNLQNPESNMTVIECQSNKGRDQLQYEYQDYIYTDMHDIIRKELKYIKTPVLLFFNNKSQITKIYQPNYDDVVTPEFVENMLNN